MPSAADGLRVTIVGGSLGGLSCAIELAAAGCEVEVLERSPVPLEGRGAGIVLHPVTTATLERLGGFDLGRLSSAATTLRFLDAEGRVEHEEPIAYRFTSYATLHAALLDRVPPARHHLGREVASLEERPGMPVVVRCRDGEVREADLVVGADGIRSIVRRSLDPTAAPRPAGYVAWRGTVDDAELPAAAGRLRGLLTYHVGRRTHILTYEIPTPGHPRARSMNWVWYRNLGGAALGDLLTDRDGITHDLSLAPGQVRPAFLDELLAAAEQLPPPCAALVRGTVDPFVQVVADLEPRVLARGRICLIGDAACVLRPHIAVGTAKAVDDGRSLAAALASRATVDDALAAWQPERLALARTASARTREVGERAQSKGTFVPGDPTLAFGLRAPFDGSYPDLGPDPGVPPSPAVS